jgi:hypothetical protein
MVRFHGLLDDDMSVSLGPGVHSWLNIDSLGDFLVSQGMRSVLELSFMPDWLASNTTTSGMRGSITRTTARRATTPRGASLGQLGEYVALSADLHLNVINGSYV